LENGGILLERVTGKKGFLLTRDRGNQGGPPEVSLNDCVGADLEGLITCCAEKELVNTTPLCEGPEKNSNVTTKNESGLCGLREEDLNPVRPRNIKTFA